MPIEWGLELPEIAEEAEVLRILIQETNSSLLAFALYRGVAEREAGVRALKERLTLPVVEFTLSPDQRNPITLLDTVSCEKRACIFFYDAEEALPDLAGYVNLQREALAEVPHAVIFWVREHGLREIATHAPDFWSWRSGVFEFRSEHLKSPLIAMQTALAEPLLFRDRGDLERRISLYQGLIREYSQDEKPDERLLARLQLKLGSIYYFLARLDQAEASAREALKLSQHVGDKIHQAAALHTLGMVLQSGWRLDKAEQMYRRSLDISEEIGHELGIASTCHELGRIAEKRKQFDQAEQWYRKALEISERLRFEQGATYGYHQLGMIAQERQRFYEAEQWYRKALEISERLRMERSAALTYHQLGNIAYLRDKFDEAEQWYRKALQIFERLGLQRDESREYHSLGIIAQERQQVDEAEQWYRRALEIFERLGNPPLKVDTLAQLGVLRREQKQLHESILWLGRALAITAEYNMPVGKQILADLARVMKDMGKKEFIAAWKKAFEGQEPPLEALREIAKKLKKKKR